MKQYQWGMIGVLGCLLGPLSTPFHPWLSLPSVMAREWTTEGDQRFSVHPLSSMTPVYELRDVAPTDWAVEALQSLMERYGCVQGYPDGTFRGDRALTRYEFAASLHSCLQNLANATEEDLKTLQRLQQEFATELGILSGQVDGLEARVSELEAQSFSTTAFFGGQVILGLSTAAGGDPPGRGDLNTLFTHQTQLAVASSFTGKDRLLMALSTGNFNNFGFANPNALNSYMALLNAQNGSADQWSLDALEYRTAAFNDRVVLTFKPMGFSLSDVLTSNTPYRDAGLGAVSRFASQSPLFQIGALESGFGFDWLVSHQVRLQAAYGTRNQGINRLTGADHSTLGVQVLFTPSDRVVAGLAYFNGYAEDGRLDTLTGSFNADTSGTFLEPAQIHALGATLQARLTDDLVLGAWGGVIYTQSLTSSAFAVSTTGLISLGLEDPFGQEGDYLGILAGIPPKLFVGGSIERLDQWTSLHLEAFYRWQVTEQLAISPGFFVVTDPGHIRENDTFLVGTIRATFRF